MKKRILCGVVSLVVFGTGIQGLAAPPDDAPAPMMRDADDPKFVERTHRFEADALLFYRNYEENIRAPARSSERGFLPGFSFRYTYQSPTPVYRLLGRVVFEYADGETRFDGTTQPPSFTPFEADTDDRLMTTEGHLGIAVNDPSRSISVAFYSGFGRWHWEREISVLTPGLSNFTEDYVRLYIPLGVRMIWKPEHGWRAGFDVTGHFMIDGEIDVNLSEIAPAFNDPELDLGNRHGIRAELPVEYELGERVSLRIAPWYRWIPIGESEVGRITVNGFPAGPVIEPGSRAWEFGARIGFGFSL